MKETSVPRLSLGLDIGGTKMEAIVLDEQGTVRLKRRIATEKQSFEAFFTGLTGFIAEIQSAVGEPVSIGIGLPGSPEPRDGLIKNSNILVINQQPLGRLLEAHFRQPIGLDNDGNCFTLSEAVDGAAQGKRTVFGIILGTGCGGGLVIDGELRHGLNACAGEWGHNALPRYRPEQDGEPVLCYCGLVNCIESFISGTGLARQYQALYGEALAAPAVIDRMRQGEPRAVRLWQRYRHQLARSLASIVNMLDPDAMVIGGGLSMIEELYDGLREEVAAFVFGRSVDTPIVRARHGDSSGVRGAAWLGKAAWRQT